MKISLIILLCFISNFAFAEIAEDGDTYSQHNEKELNTKAKKKDKDEHETNTDTKNFRPKR